MSAPDDPVYLDHNATTPLLPEVVDAMLPYLREHFGNPSSAHAYGRRAREGVDRARAQVASLLGCSPDEIVFTSGGTEASNLAIRGTLGAHPARRHVVTTAAEHPATTATLAALDGVAVTSVPVGPDGRVDGSAMGDALRDDTALVTMIHGQNETGVLQPVAEVARRAKARGVAVHVDAAQSAGKVDVRVDALGCDLMTVVGHKLYGPKGVGALYVRAGTALVPFARGAGHERGLRPGTENVASLVGFGAACAAAARDLAASSAHALAMRERLWARLREAVPGAAINGHPTERLPNTLSVRLPGVSGDAVLARCPDVAASTGSACHAGETRAPGAVLALGVAPEEAIGTLRLTTGRRNTAEDVDRAAASLAAAWRALVTAGG
jgi:cysteine desulfurase